MMPRRLYILAYAKVVSCALGPFSVGYTMSISGHLRALIEFLRTTGRTKRLNAIATVNAEYLSGDSGGLL
jgi:hypothetical protein